MSREQLEKIVFGVMIAILSIIAIYTGLLLLFITVPSGVILFTPVWLILSKSKKDYSLKWIMTLQCIIIIIITLVIIFLSPP